jgi:mRNA-degrading endonuclease RelE of RelBE toxin-antitoxin system
VPKREVIFSPDAAGQFKRLGAADRARLKQAIQASLAEDDATTVTRNRFPLRRPSERACFELRVGELRIFYRVVGSEIRITLIGRKRGNQLLVNGKRFTL